MKTRRILTILLVVLLLVACIATMSACNWKKPFGSTTTNKKPNTGSGSGTTNDTSGTTNGTTPTVSGSSYDFSKYDMTKVESLITFFDYIETNPNFTIDIVINSTDDDNGNMVISSNGTNTLTVEGESDQYKIGRAYVLHTIDDNHYGYDYYEYNYTSSEVTKSLSGSSSKIEYNSNTLPYYYGGNPAIATELFYYVCFIASADQYFPCSNSDSSYTYDLESQSFKSSLSAEYQSASIEVKFEDNKCIINYTTNYGKEINTTYKYEAIMYNIGNTVVTLPPDGEAEIRPPEDVGAGGGANA